MKSRNLVAILTAIAVLAVGIFVSFYLLWDASDGTKAIISLPEQGEADIGIDVDIGKNNLKIVDELKIDKGNVKSVIETLKRPTEYTYTAKTTYYYGESSKSFQTEGAVRGELSRALQYDQGGVLQKKIILSSDSVFIWNDKNNGYYKGKRGDFTGDDLARVPSYEDILQIPDKRIIDATSEMIGKQLCICVKTQNEITGYDEEWYISLHSGLLIAAKSYEKDALAYEMELTGLSDDPVADDIFTLPDGTAL